MTKWYKGKKCLYSYIVLDPHLRGELTWAGLWIWEQHGVSSWEQMMHRDGDNMHSEKLDNTIV